MKVVKFKTMQSQETKKWPVAITAGFMLIFIASFMTWGTIRYHYTSQFMANMEHPGLCNRILTGDDLSGLKLERLILDNPEPEQSDLEPCQSFVLSCRRVGSKF